jgi:AcrR family transcriptional regulator
MSIPYERTGRTNQKARTRTALVAAARELLADGVTPTVELAAERAHISRTAAYRYFPNQRALLIATYPEVELRSQLGTVASSDPVVRLDAVVEAITDQVVEHAPELRTQLRLSLEPTPPQSEAIPFRQGRAIGWIEDALAPLRPRLPEAEMRRLVLAIRATIGIEALVWLTDVAELSQEEAVEVMRWSAHSLLRSVLTEHQLGIDRSPGRAVENERAVSS